MSCIQRAALWANLFTNINGDGLSGEPLPGDPRCWQGFQPSQYHPRVDCCFPPPRGNPVCWDEGAFTYDNCCVEPHCSDLQRISDITEHIPTMEPWRLSPADPDNPIRLMGYVDKCFDVVAAYTMAVMTHHLRHAMYSYHNLTDPAQLDMRWHHYRSGFLIRNRLEEARSRGVKTDVRKLRKQLDQAKLLGTRIHRLAKNTAHLLPVLQEIRRHVDYLALNDSIAQGPNEIPLMSYAHRHHSQTGTDGILAALLASLGRLHRPGYYIEFGVQFGEECNTRALRLRYGWKGITFDSQFSNPLINLHRQFITASNVNEVFTSYGVPSEFDVLSIDIDGQDYHVWAALECCRPAILVIEVDLQLGKDMDFIVNADEDYVWSGYGSEAGTSARAMWKLAQRKEYALVAMHGGDMYFVDERVLPPRRFRYQNDLDAIFDDYVMHDEEILRGINPRLVRG